MGGGKELSSAVPGASGDPIFVGVGVLVGVNEDALGVISSFTSSKGVTGLGETMPNGDLEFVAITESN